MRRALRLACQALGDTSPNPLVGAVVVRHGRVVGQGYHRRAGLPHAEVEALRQAGAQASGAILYVTLEPCNHVGRTPPCVDAVIAAGIRHVVIAMRDPNPLTNGQGIARLRRAGVRVETGMLAEEARRLNEPFVKYITRKMPWVIAKVAQSLDGKIATRTGESRWISSVASRQLVHRLRRQVDGIMVGVNTILRDDPLLSARSSARFARVDRPVKVIVDSHLRTPLSSRCLSASSPAPTMIATTERSPTKRASFERRGVEVLVVRAVKGRVPLRPVFRELARRHQITSLLIEGGGEVLASALSERLVDRLVWYVAPILIGGRTSPPAIGGEGISRLAEAVRLKDVVIRRVGPDVVWDAAVVYPQ